MDLGGLSGGDTISSSSHSLAQASPGSPRSPLSPCSPSSPWSPARSENGHGHPFPEDMDSFGKGDMLDARLDEARLNSRSLAALASPRPPPNPSPVAPSRVMAMRQQVEAREQRAKEESEELLLKGESNLGRQLLTLARSPSPKKMDSMGGPSPGTGVVSRRVPVPPLASGIKESISRDSSLGSIPQSPTKSTLMRGGTLTRAGTLSPRGPRNLPGRNGYVPPLPPPTSTAGSSIKSPLRAGSVEPSTLEDALEGDTSATDDIDSISADVGPLPPSPPIATTETVVRRPLPIPQLPPSASMAPVTTSRLIGLGAAPKLRSTSRNRVPSNPNDENVPPALAQKRAHPAEHLSPRKRTPSDSPMSRREGEVTPTQSQSQTHTPRYPSGLGTAPSSRPGSGSGSTRVVTPRGERRASGALTPSRRVSSIASVASVASVTSNTSTATVATVCTLSSAIEQYDIVMSDHSDLASAADAARQTVCCCACLFLLYRR